MSKEIKIEFWQDLEFTPIDGVTRTMKDFFKEADFVKAENDTIFVKYSALLRILKRLFIIVQYDTNIVQVAEKSNDWCVTVQARFLIAPIDNLGRQTSWASCADCNKGNAPPGFERYTTTIAETDRKSVV